MTFTFQTDAQPNRYRLGGGGPRHPDGKSTEVNSKMKKHTHKGSFTVEMAIIFPIIFIVILGTLRLCITHYDNLTTATAAMQAAARGAAYWDTMGRDYTNHDPYRYIFDSKAGDKTKKVAEYAEALMTSGNISSETETLTVRKTGNILQKYVEVSVVKKNLNPMAQTLRNLGLNVPETYLITAKAPLNTPTEFIRMVSFIYDLVTEEK